MGNFWMGIAAANSAAKVNSRTRAHHILSIVAGIVIALLIGAGLFVIAALTT
jgi:hypothetical protein